MSDAVIRDARRNLARAATTYRLVAVAWEDSQQPVPRWQWLEEYEMPEAVTCISVGFLIAQTDAALAIAPNLGDVQQARAQASGIICIPTSAVKWMAHLQIEDVDPREAARDE